MICILFKCLPKFAPMNVFRSFCSSVSSASVAAIEDLSSAEGDATALLGFGDLDEYTLDPADFNSSENIVVNATISSVFLKITLMSPVSSLGHASAVPL